MSPLKTFALQMLTLPGVDTIFSPFTRGRAAVFMLHRFRSASPEQYYHNVSGVRRALAHLRRQECPILSLEHLLRLSMSGSQIPDGAVAFTIDDGYADQAAIAGPAFAEFDCPVTTFVTTGFLDGQLWFWWDRIDFVFRWTQRRWLRLELGGAVLEYRWSNDAERARAQTDFTNRCKLVPDAVKHAGIEHLAEEADVSLPTRPPSEYMPMTWDQLRAAERHGMSFGAHTVTHPILSRVSDEAARWELSESWRRLQAEAREPVPIFCYPNGGPDDFSSREIGILKQLGFIGAVVGSEGYLCDGEIRRNEREQFVIRRFPFPDDLAHLTQYVGGAERAKSLLRGVAR